MTTAAFPDYELRIITEQLDGGTVRLQVTGDVDLATAPQLGAALLAVAEAATPLTEIAVDLAGVKFIDSVGIGVLIRGRNAARLAGARLSVHNPQPIVARLFHELGLTDTFRAT